MVGGDNSYTIYYNFFISNFVTAATCFIDLTKELNIADVKLIGEAIELRGASLLGELRTIPCITNIETAYQMVVGASQLADAEDENGYAKIKMHLVASPCSRRFLGRHADV